MPAKGKYNEDVLNTIASVLRKTGRDKDAFEAAGISRDTFYTWKKTKPEFSDLIDSAKSDFVKTCPETLRQKAIEGVAKYLNGEAVEIFEKWTTVKDKDGNITSETHAVSHVTRPVPQWIIDRVLGKSLPIIEAMQILLDQGIATPAQAATVSEGVAEIERKLKELAALEPQRAALEQALAVSETVSVPAEENKP